jgi:hypothetical protein
MLSETSRLPVALGLLLVGIPLQAAPPTYPCYRPPVAPALDGEVADDPAWQSIPAVTGFSVLGGTYTLPKQTRVQACWDGDALYVVMTCEEPDAPDLQTTVADGGAAWLDDGVEIFVQAAGAPQAFQVVITAAGVRASGSVAPDLAQVAVGTRIGADTYWVEARIPFSILGATPQVGDRWRANFCRNTWTTRSGGDKFTSWAPLTRSFNEPESFATLAFEGPPADPAEHTRVAHELNLPYRASLLTRLRAAAARESDYADALRTAARDVEFGRRARTLRRRWREIDSALRDADIVPIGDLRRTVGGADALVQESYDLKYAYLIAALLREH